MAWRVLFNNDKQKFEAVSQGQWGNSIYRPKHPDEENVTFDTLKEAEHWMVKEYMPEFVHVRDHRRKKKEKVNEEG